MVDLNAGSANITPIWGRVMQEVFGEVGPMLLHLVRETKSTTVADALRGTENQKTPLRE